MYTEFYKLKEKPFNLTPDPQYLFLSRECEEALNHLIFGVNQKEGFILITGEVGTGKTTLCRSFIEKINKDRFETALILNPFLTETELLKEILEDLGEKPSDDSKKDLLHRLYELLLSKNEEGKRIIVIVDEAQNLSNQLLEQLRILSNFETTKEKLLQIILFGQQELVQKLSSDELRQLNQRISVRYTITPLKKEEVSRYITHRLAVAGALGNIGFSRGALSEVYRFSKGIPRLVNLVCDRSLLGAYVLKTSDISKKIVKAAVKSLAINGLEKKRPFLRKPVFQYSLLTLMFGGAAFSGYFFLPLDKMLSKGEQKQVQNVSYVTADAVKAPSTPSVQPLAEEKAKKEIEKKEKTKPEVKVKKNKNEVKKQVKNVEREKNYSLYYASFRNKSDALSELNRLKKYDKEVRLSKVNMPKKGVRFWILSGFYVNEDEAYKSGKEIVKRINNKYNIAVVQVLKDKED